MHSIIVTIHNGARRLPNGEVLLEKVLDGIVNNTVGDYELLCMLDGSLNRVGGQGSRSARTSIALLCLLCVQVPKTPFQASSNNIGIVRWCGKG